MAVLRRPGRPFSFYQHQLERAHNQTVPGDQLDAVIADLIEAVASTQEALADLRRDDGTLMNRAVGLPQLDASVADHLRDGVKRGTEPLVYNAEQAAKRARAAEEAIALYARDAERAAVVAMQSLSKIEHIQSELAKSIAPIPSQLDTAQTFSTDAENWANYSEAQAGQAKVYRDESLQWAEYLAGPVVSGPDAPAYIADSAFPQGLYYAPVQGYGGVAGLWSAKWWAIYASQIVGPWAFYYFGPWPSPPMPGMRNSDTGQVIPDPIGPGSIYYDTTAQMAMVWNGHEWIPATTIVAGYKAQYVYLATAGQTTFSGPDINGQTPGVGDAASDVYLNGVLQVQGAAYDYTISGNVLTMAMPLPAGTVVQWILVPKKPAPNPVKAYAITLNAAPDGTRTAFTMSYSGGAVNAGTSSELLVSLDGIVQQPGTDYTAVAATLTFAAAPVAGARLWVTWWSPS